MSAITISESELQLVLARCDPEMRVAMLLSHRLGLRVAEIAAADFAWVLTATADDIGDTARIPAVAQKGASRERRYLCAATLPVADDLRDALRVLWAARRFPVRGPVVRTLHGSGMDHVSPSALAQRMKAIYRVAGMPHASSHSGRRSLGTAAAREMNVSTVARVLRHSDISSTLHYIESASDPVVSSFMKGVRS